MTRWLALVLAVYVPHVLEEALTGMHDDPLIVAALAPLESLTARHSAYLVFQIMLLASLGLTLLFSLGDRARRLVLLGLGVALAMESHHALRALFTHAYNPGLLTSLPMPVVGFLVMRRLFSSSKPLFPAVMPRPHGVLS